MVVRIIAVIACLGSISTAATTWSNPATDPVQLADADVTSTIQTIVFSKAGRSATRISAGLSGDWAAQPVAVESHDRPKVVLSPLNSKLAEPQSLDPVFESPAAALPLPPATVAFVPSVLIAWVAKRRLRVV